ncbi:helix-turn-helix domain-containing protein [Bacillus sp. JJ1532]|uniref:helix-turn-helix domain-containing protein n=1 Tax=unclassified Bacillus (in: firmicutes) TaxID=185979 RepID=UPI002FFF146F
MVGMRIKRLRIEKGLSINELSEKAGVSKSYLSYIERGIQQNPSLQVLSRLAKTLDTDVEDLLDQKKKAEPTEMYQIDREWIELIHDAIDIGVTKEEFAYYLDFIKFKNMNGGNE